MKNLAFLAVLLLGSGLQEKKGLEIYWIDTEGGAATLVVTPEGESLLMDTGFPGNGDRDARRIHEVATKVAKVRQIDHYLTSHWHLDHWGGVEALSRLMPMARFYDHGFPGEEAKDVDPKLKEAYVKASEGKRTVLKPGDSVPLKGAEVRILAAHTLVAGEAPGSPQTRACSAHEPMKDDDSDNARSLGFLLSWNGFRFLDNGDLTWNVEHKLVCPKNLVGEVDVYQVTHHGQDISNHPALLKAASPTVAILNNGPKKGGSKVTYARLRDLPGLKDVWQLHRNVATSAADNAPPEFVANADEKCEGRYVKVAVDPSGKSYTVEIPATGAKREYKTK